VLFSAQQSPQAEVKPFTISVSLSHWNLEAKDLTVSVDAVGNAVIVLYGKTHKGKFDPKTNKISLSFSILDFSKEVREQMKQRPPDVITGVYYFPTEIVGSETWVLRLRTKSDGSYSLKSFGQRKEYDNGTKETTLFQFTSEGLLESYVVITDFDTVKTKRKATYTYIKIEEKTLLESHKEETKSEWTKFSGWGEKQVKKSRNSGTTFYSYNKEGNLTAQVSVHRNKIDGVVQNYGVYYLFDGNKRIEAMTGMIEKNLRRIVKSARDWVIIEKFVNFKIESHYTDASHSQYLFIIEYARDEAGIFVPKSVRHPSEGKTYIVQGEPDVVSGESDDILIKGGYILFGGYRVYYGCAFDDAGKYVGCGLVFQQVLEVPSLGYITIVVDYPKEKKIVLDDTTYLLSINSEGNVILHDLQGNILSFSGGSGGLLNDLFNLPGAEFI
jgi:hypothetical protein